MTNPPAAVVRPVARWVRGWAAATAGLALALLFVLGGFVTSFRVGMADPVWPTEPWYLVGKDWSRLEFGFLVEHTHRAAGWVVGLMVGGLALGAWAGEPDRRLRWFGLAAIVAVLGAYGGFHGGMRAADLARKGGTPPGDIPLPVASGGATLFAAGVCVLLAGVAVAGGRPGRWARAVAMIALLGVMVQGLLGGFRVFLNALAGDQLAAYHGVFAQVVLSLLFAVVILSAPRRPGDALPPADRRRLGGPAAVLPAVVFVQLVWAAWVRHMGTPLAQRLHILTAFVVVGLAVWLAARVAASPAGRRQLGSGVLHLLGLIAVQVGLGVEAYLGKFASIGPYAAVPPLLRPVDEWVAAVRTAHAVVGAGLLATAVVLALRANRRPLRIEAAVAENPAESALEPATASV